MSLKDRILELAFKSQLDEYKKDIQRDIVEARDDSQDDYMWSNTNKNTYVLDEGKLNQVARRAQYLYESDGLAKMIVNRIVTYVFEKGFSLDLKFEEGVSERDQDVIRKAVYDKFWDSEDIDLMNRVERLIRESSLTGEHGWRIQRFTDGSIILGDFVRDEVEKVVISKFDSSKVKAVLFRSDTSSIYSSEQEEAKRLKLIVDTVHDPSDPLYKHLRGDIFFYRLNDRSYHSRGVSDLQQVIDEITDKKRFWRLAQDKILNMMSVFLEITVSGADESKLREMRKLYGEYKPKDGEVRYVNDQIKHEWVLPDIKSMDVTEHFKTMLGSVLGSLGMPLSWFSFGDEANYATAKSQGSPFFADMEKRQKSIIRLLETVVRYVIDQQIRVGNVPVMSGGKLTRDSIIVSVSPTSLTADTEKGKPNALKMASEVAGLLAVFQQETGVVVFSEKDFISLFNQAMSIDGIDIELEQTEYDADKHIPAPVIAPDANLN